MTNYIITYTSLFIFAFLLIFFRKRVKSLFENHKMAVTIIYSTIFLSIVSLRTEEAIQQGIQGNWSNMKASILPTDLCPFLVLFGSLIIIFPKSRDYFALLVGAWSMIGSTLTLGGEIVEIKPQFTKESFKDMFFGTIFYLHWVEFLLGITLLIIAKPMKKKTEWIRPFVFIGLFLLIDFVVISIFNVEKYTTLLRDADLTDPKSYKPVGDIFHQKHIPLARFLFYMLMLSLAYVVVGACILGRKLDKKWEQKFPNGIIQTPKALQFDWKSTKTKFDKWNKKQ